MGEALFIERYDGRIDDEFHAEFTSLAPSKAGQKRARIMIVKEPESFRQV
ncbi:hypothetical protein C048_02929 [Brucella melitensis UK19/04]|nr:hypothetical protein C962_02922 [Brucella melitensis CNGB 1076]ENQ71917.1 hypothetical protein C963_02926 [Brucella melitensis CNGB 1120]ENQ74791.1 hypothetical protein C964_02920 [Brucella melitensis CNGB 290]ENQ78464.1 hypothetical protein C057_02259 [Brucella melitensis F10/05-2]ENQ84514.1 hypothetical protein C056_02238 [Brucella melitensis F3/02]ENQ95461.1 hypothetical protein C048_02929 [Brucella melitensis UK19/04]ENS55806.1 hypothetical protein C036_02245 [Brucella melitensis F1/06